MSAILSEQARIRRGGPVPCDWCNELINTGDPYCVSGNVNDGCAYTLRLHVECRTAVDDSDDPHGDGVDQGRWRAAPVCGGL